MGAFSKAESFSAPQQTGPDQGHAVMYNVRANMPKRSRPLRERPVLFSARQLIGLMSSPPTRRVPAGSRTSTAKPIGPQVGLHCSEQSLFPLKRQTA